MKQKSKKNTWVKIIIIIALALVLLISLVTWFFHKVISLPQGEEAIASMDGIERDFLDKVINNINESSTEQDLVSLMGEPSEKILVGEGALVKWSYPSVPSGQVRIYYYKNKIAIVRWITFTFIYEKRFDSGSN